jgi:hypothetical protein
MRFIAIDALMVAGTVSAAAAIAMLTMMLASYR